MKTILVLTLLLINQEPDQKKPDGPKKLDYKNPKIKTFEDACKVSKESMEESFKIQKDREKLEYWEEFTKVKWISDYKEAVKIAKEKQKLLLVFLARDDMTKEFC